MIKISVIVPVYNSEKYLYQCLETILGQTLQETEVILIDDGSTDSSYQICKEFADRDGRVRLYHQENKGAGAARNLGIELARGEYLSFLDSDDFFELDMLQTLYRRAKITDSDITFCNFWEFDDITKEDKEVEWSFRSKLIPKKQPFSARDCPNTIFQLSNNGATWASLYKKSFVLKNNIQYATHKRAEDVCFSRSALVMAKRISCINKRLLHYRINTISTLSSSAEKYQYAVFNSYSNLRHYLEEKNVFHNYKKSFLEAYVSSCIHYEFCFLRYPLRFLSEAYFVDNVVSKYCLATLPKENFSNQSLCNKIKECIQSSTRSLSLRLWYEEKPNKIIPIVLATNEQMARACGVTIQSIITHISNDHFYDIYILYTDLSDCMKARLENMVSKNVHITTICVKNLVNGINFPYRPAVPHVTKDAYYRLFISSILSYDKVLWLDSDLVAQTDISELYDVDLGDNLVAGVADILSDEEEKKRTEWGMEPLNHINTGVLLINNKLWQEENLQKKYTDEISHPHYPYTFNDQDIINFVCQDRILLLDHKWNFLYAAFRARKDKYELYIGSIDPYDCSIIHYNGSAKPWNSLGSDLFDVWWRYAVKCPFYPDILYQHMKMMTENIPPTTIQSSSLTKKQTQRTLDDESIYQLRCSFIKKAFGYWFSFGKRKKSYKLDLDMIMQKLRDG